MITIIESICYNLLPMYSVPWVCENIKSAEQNSIQKQEDKIDVANTNEGVKSDCNVDWKHSSAPKISNCAEINDIAFTVPTTLSPKRKGIKPIKAKGQAFQKQT